ncbi:MAG: phosphatidylserine decarboxylase family protein [Bacteroidia bacterium]|nr:phosphatidylserine decarboxylase family protein [Bacteroidia bacterium]
MTLHREGTATITLSAFLTVIIIIGAYWGLKDTSFFWLIYPISAIVLVFLLLILNFFRNPTITILTNEKHILAPCDGKVVVIEEVFEPKFFQAKVRQVSIFMSPLNVHVNRNPVSGIVVVSQYLPGKYLVAWHPKSSEENEQTFIVVQNDRLSVAYKQIAGALARRICCYLKEGDSVEQGQEFGFIKFGSRMDILFPLNCEVKVQLEQKTTGGQTVIAELQ